MSLVSTDMSKAMLNAKLAETGTTETKYKHKKRQKERAVKTLKTFHQQEWFRSCGFRILFRVPNMKSARATPRSWTRKDRNACA